MMTMTEAQALAEGLTVLDPDGAPAWEPPADRADWRTERADWCARQADELAAVVESMLRLGGASVAGLVALQDKLGELHVECDQLAEDFRELLRAHPWAGVA